MKQESRPGDGIKSLRTSSAFKALNFELYAAPNKVIMALGLTAIGFCTAYIIYMRKKYEGMGYYAALKDNGDEIFLPKKSKWDD